MSLGGTASYSGLDGLPPLVARAVEGARREGFVKSCRAAHGRLLSVLAGGVGDGTIGETGTGCGVGLAWLVTGASAGARLVSVELDVRLAAAAREVFADEQRVAVLDGDWSLLEAHAPFDLLCLDGGGQGKHGEAPIDPTAWLRPGGVLVMDDFTPGTTWPPTYDGAVDQARLAWLEHPLLLATELRTEPDAAAIVAVRRPARPSTRGLPFSSVTR
jgi:predicted O-methyltransferase YrrM